MTGPRINGYFLFKIPNPSVKKGGDPNIKIEIGQINTLTVGNPD